MKAGISYGIDSDGVIVGARLMGGADQCLDVQLPTEWDRLRFCVLPYPHEGREHDYSGEMKDDD